MRASGMAYGKIAAALNREGVPSPRVYWYRQMGKEDSKVSQMWGCGTVKLMLRNEVYRGNLVMNHTGTNSPLSMSPFSRMRKSPSCTSSTVRLPSVSSS